MAESSTSKFPLLDLKASHLSLSIVRIGFFLTCFGELFHLYIYRDLSYKPEHFFTAEYILPLALLSNLAVALGFRFRFFAIINYILILKVLADCYVRYHFDYAMHSLAFIFLFAPNPQTLSIDSFLSKKENPQELIPTWFFFMLFLGVELVYFDSLFFKYTSHIWLEGYTFWMPAALPHFSNQLFPDFLEIGWLMKGLGLISLFFETTFPLVLFKRLRFLYFLLGFGLHLGILIFFPIPWFGLGFCIIFFMFLDTNRILNIFKKQKIKSIYDLEYPKSNLIWNRIGWTLCVVLFLSQSAIVATRLLPTDHWYNKGPGKFNRKYIASAPGLTDHPVYIDWHFGVKSPILRFHTEVNGKMINIPTFTENSYPRYPETTGRFFVWQLFAMRSNHRSLSQLEQGTWSTFLFMWFRHMDLEPRDVHVSYHKIEHEIGLNFSDDDRIESEPFKEAGVMRFEENSFRGEWNEEFIKIFDNIRKESKTS